MNSTVVCKSFSYQKDQHITVFYFISLGSIQFNFNYSRFQFQLFQIKCSKCLTQITIVENVLKESAKMKKWGPTINITTDNVLPAATARDLWIPVVWPVRQTPVELSAHLGTGGDQDVSLLVRFVYLQETFWQQRKKNGIFLLIRNASYVRSE